MPKLPDLSPITSSMMTEAGYDPDSRTLVVRMKNGAAYQYDEVPADVGTAFLGNASPGSFFSKKIKGLYPATKL